MMFRVRCGGSVRVPPGQHWLPELRKKQQEVSRLSETLLLSRRASLPYDRSADVAARVRAKNRGGVIDRDEWLDLARKLDWELTYVDEREAFPEAVSGRPWLDGARW